jgi:hypothetical protein
VTIVSWKALLMREHAYVGFRYGKLFGLDGSAPST